MLVFVPVRVALSDQLRETSNPWHTSSSDVREPSKVCLPFDVEFCDPWLVCQYVPDQLVEVGCRVRPSLGWVELGLVPLILERTRLEFCVDVVANTDKLLFIVRASQQDDSHSNQIATRDPRRQRGRRLQLAINQQSRTRSTQPAQPATYLKLERVNPQWYWSYHARV